MKAQHTPRPWRIERNKLKGKADYVMAGNYSVAMLFDGYDAADANARLIAAAPELLEACKSMLESILVTGRLPQSEIDKAQSAISKATGL